MKLKSIYQLMLEVLDVVKGQRAPVVWYAGKGWPFVGAR